MVDYYGMKKSFLCVQLCICSDLKKNSELLYSQVFFITYLHIQLQMGASCCCVMWNICGTCHLSTYYISCHARFWLLLFAFFPHILVILYPISAKNIFIFKGFHWLCFYSGHTEFMNIDWRASGYHQFIQYGTFFYLFQLRKSPEGVVCCVYCIIYNIYLFEFDKIL